MRSRKPEECLSEPLALLPRQAEEQPLTKVLQHPWTDFSHNTPSSSLTEALTQPVCNEFIVEHGGVGIYLDPVNGCREQKITN